MHYDRACFRPPSERYYPLLQVTIGCSHNKCTFCTMYKGTKFSLAPENEIIEDLEEVASYDKNAERVFLLNGDAFCLNAEKLLHIADLIHKYLPNVKKITSYCSVINIRNKSLEDLKKLREEGYDNLYIGLESGYDPALKQMNKGADSKESLELLLRLNEAGFKYCILLISGIGGKGKCSENAKATAEILNKIKPKRMAVMPLSIEDGSEYENFVKDGTYVEPSEKEKIEELIELLELLDLPDDSFFDCAHPFNFVPIYGHMSAKSEMIEELKKGLSTLPKELLDKPYKRGYL